MYAPNSRKISQIHQRRVGVNKQPELLILREGITSPNWESKLHEIPAEHLDEINKHFDMEETRGKKTQDYTPFNYAEYSKPIFTTNKNQKSLQDAQARRVVYEEQLAAGKIKNIAGSLEDGDIISRFKRLRRYQDRLNNNVLEFWVEWKPRKDGTKPEDSIISNQDLKVKDAGTLIDFYESILEFESEEPQEEEVSNSGYMDDKENIHPGFAKPAYETIDISTRECTPATGKSILDEEKDAQFSTPLQQLYGTSTLGTDPQRKPLEVLVNNRKYPESQDKSDFLQTGTGVIKSSTSEQQSSNQNYQQQKHLGNYISESSESQSN